MAVYVAAIAFVASGVQGAETAREQKKVNEEARVQNQLNKRKADVRNARQRVNLVRKARIAQAQVIASSEATGGSGGSGVAGGTASIGSQVAGNIGFVNRIGAIDTGIFASKDREGAALSSAARSQAIGGLADSIFSTSISRT